MEGTRGAAADTQASRASYGTEKHIGVVTLTHETFSDRWRAPRLR